MAESGCNQGAILHQSTFKVKFVTYNTGITEVQGSGFIIGLHPDSSILTFVIYNYYNYVVISF